MSSASGASLVATPSSSAATRHEDLAARLTEPAVLVMFAVVGGAFLLLFHNFFLNQHGHSWGNGDWSHSYMVPFISIYLMWQSRQAIERTPAAIFWPGILPVLVGVFAYFFFTITPAASHWVQGLCMVLTLFGVVLLLTGPALMKYLFFPIAYLGFGITPPEMVMNYLTYPLQDLAARGGYVLLRMLSVSCDITGNVITIFYSDGSPHPLNVAEQCSGMRMVIAFLALGAAVALVGTRVWWKRVVLLALAGPIAVLLNIIRVAVLGIASLANADLAAGQAHTFIGTVLLVPGLLLYMLVLVALNKASPDAPTPGGKPGKGGPSKVGVGGGAASGRGAGAAA